MRKILIFTFTLFASFFISCQSEDTVSVQITTKNSGAEVCGQLKSRFLVTSNEMYSENVRHLNVFMDESAFSEDNLTQMFKYLETRYKDVKILVINVKTNWKQISFPDDCMNGMAISNSPYDPSIFDYYHATYTRSNFSDIGRRENFKYNPELKVEKYKTVHMKSVSN